MGTVHPIRDQGHMALGIVEAFLVTLDHPESRGTRRVYASTLRALRAEFGDATDVAGLDPDQVAAWLARQWGQVAPATWNRDLDAIRAAPRVLERPGVDDRAPAARPCAAARAADRTRARPARCPGPTSSGCSPARTSASASGRCGGCCTRPPRGRPRCSRLDVEDLDLPNRRAKVRRKGGAIDVIVWQTGTARLLPRLLKGRKSGPVFVTERKARVQLPAADLDEHGHARLSYQQAEALFSVGLRRRDPAPAPALCPRLVDVSRLATDRQAGKRVSGCPGACRVSMVSPHDLELLFQPGLGVLGCRAPAADPRGHAGADR